MWTLFGGKIVSEFFCGGFLSAIAREEDAPAMELDIRSYYCIRKVALRA